MSFFSGSEVEKKAAQSQKKKRQVVPLSDQPPKKLLEITKKRIDAVYTPIVELTNELEQKRNAIVTEISNFEIAQKNLADADKKPVPTTAWDFIEKRCKRKEKEKDGALKKRKGAIMEMMQNFIEEELFSDDKTGRIVQWFRSKGLLNLEFFESAGGMFMDNGKQAKSNQEDQWHGLLRYTIGKRILACIAATDDIKELLGKIVVLSGFHDTDTDRQESYFQRLYSAVSKDLLFGAPKEKKESAEKSTKLKRKAEESDNEEDDDGSFADDVDLSDDGGNGEEDDDDDSRNGEDDDEDEDEESKRSDSSGESAKKKRRNVEVKKQVLIEKKTNKEEKLVDANPNKLRDNGQTPQQNDEMFVFVAKMIKQDADGADTDTLREIEAKTDLSKNRIKYCLLKGSNEALRTKIENEWKGHQSLQLSVAEFNQLFAVVEEIHKRESSAAVKQEEIAPQDEKRVLEQPPPPPVEAQEEMKVDVKVEPTN